MEKISKIVQQKESYEEVQAKMRAEADKKEKKYGIPAEDILWHARDIKDAEKAKDIISSGKVAVILEKWGAYYPSGSYLDEEVSTSTSEVVEFNSQKEAEDFMNKNAESKEAPEYEEKGPGVTINDMGRWLHMALPGKKLFSQEKKYNVKKTESGQLAGLEPNGYYLVEITEKGRVGIPQDQLQNLDVYEPRKLIDTREVMLLKVIKSKDSAGAK